MDLCDLGAVDASRLIAAREVRADELLGACLDRIAALDPVVRAFVAVAPLDATSGDAELLTGMPVGIKDIIDVGGVPTTAASRVLAGYVPAKDAPVVARLRAAGASMIGKTNTQEFAYGVVTSPTRNPWDVRRIPGGSSGGSAAAVAAGMCPVALGTDTAGSIRIPSALCGISGLRPRRAAVPMDGIVPLAPTLDACGPLARTAEDLAFVWNALTGHEPVALRERKLVIAAPDPGSVTEVEAEVAAAVGAAIATMGELWEVRSTEMDRFDDWDLPRAIVLMSEALQVHRDRGWYPERAALYSGETLGSLRYAERFDDETIGEARKRVRELVVRFLAAFASADVLVLPVTPVAAPTVEAAAVTDDGHRPPVVRSLTRICGPINVCDLAAVAVPCGFTAAGLPIGMQLVARDEGTALAAARWFQEMTTWHERRPPLDRLNRP